MKTFKGKPVTLVGEQVKVGDKVSDFKVVNINFEPTHLSDFKNEYILISVIPSLDTAVCDLQTKTINEELLKNDKIDIKVITISNDLPFAQNRWVNDEELEGVTILSDYLYGDFGQKFGVLMKENKLLARVFYVLNKKREVIFMLDVNEQGQHLDYDKLLNFINELPGK